MNHIDVEVAFVFEVDGDPEERFIKFYNRGLLDNSLSWCVWNFYLLLKSLPIPVKVDTIRIFTQHTYVGRCEHLSKWCIGNDSVKFLSQYRILFSVNNFIVKFNQKKCSL